MTTEPSGKRKYANCTNYSEVIQMLGYVHCPGGCAFPGIELGVAGHGSGFTSSDERGLVIHWEERRLTRRGLRLLLLLIARTRYPVAGEFPWLRLYEADQYANRQAKRFHVRFPRSWSALERAKARHSLMTSPPRPIDKEFPEQRKLLRRVDRWARP